MTSANLFLLIRRMTLRAVLLGGLSLAFSLCAQTPKAEESPEEMPRFDSLAVGSVIYTNVVVESRGRSALMIRHADGFASIQVEELTPEARTALGYMVREPAAEVLKEKLVQLEEMSRSEALNVEGFKNLGFGVLAVALALGFVVYLFSCIVFRNICIKAGKAPGLLIWIPLLQLVPLFRAAGMSVLWLLCLFLVPIASIMTTLHAPEYMLWAGLAPALFGTLLGVIWAFRISLARGRPPLFGVLLLLPGVNLFALVYLAFAE
jgi:hypothetical protein